MDIPVILTPPIPGKVNTLRISFLKEIGSVWSAISNMFQINVEFASL